MPRFAALAVLALLGATTGCFNVNYGDCRITCSQTETCPSGLTCMLEPGKNHGLCAEPGGQTCSFPDDLDAGTDVDAMDAADAMDASDAPDATDAPDGEALPPKVLCRDTDCLELSDALRANLVLLLWPSNLDAVGSEVPEWSDQSGQGNHARALSSIPHVTSSGVKLDTDTPGSGFYVRHSQSLDFAAGDFAIIVVAGLVSNIQQVALFAKADGTRPPGQQRQITLDWKLSSATSGRPRANVNNQQIEASVDTYQPSIAVYAVQRISDHVELRKNSTVLNSADLPLGESTTNSEGIYIGTGSLQGYVADTIHAVIAVRGQISSTDRDALESFLTRNFAEQR